MNAISAAATSSGTRARGTSAAIRTAPANDVAACADGNESDRGTRPNGSRPAICGRSRATARFTT